jgi:hypothetical protein
MAAIASARHRTGAGPVIDSKGEAIAELMLEVAQCFFRIRALGQKTGLITSWGGGAFGFMRSLALLGPLTVPQIAQMRPTSRQRMQRLADELEAASLVEFIDNPKHRRSRLVRLTRKGVGLSRGDIRGATEVVRRLSRDVKAGSERLRDSRRQERWLRQRDGTGCQSVRPPGETAGVRRATDSAWGRWSPDRGGRG